MRTDTPSGHMTPIRSVQRRSRDREFYFCRPNRFSIERFASPKNLKSAWNFLKHNGGQAPGVDDAKFTDLIGRDFWKLIKMASESIVSGTYRPEPVKTVRTPKGDGRFRELSIQTVLDRTIAKAFYDCFEKYWKSKIPNFHPCVRTIFRRLEEHIQRRDGHYILAIDDIRDCFPSTDNRAALECQFEHFRDEKLRALAQQIILGHEGQMNPVGIGQGSPYSPTVVEAFLHYRFDKAMKPDLSRWNTSLFRYVDNLPYLTSDFDVATRVIDRTREVLNEIGYDLKGKDGIVDLRENETQSLLGFIPKWNTSKDKLELRISDDAFSKLKESLEEANIQQAPIDRVLRGWTNAYAPAFDTVATDELVGKLQQTLQKAGFGYFKRGKIKSYCDSAKRHLRNSLTGGRN